MRTVADRIRHLDPCQAAWAWADDYTDPAKAWADCPNGSWMLWLLGHSERSAPWSEERKPLLACCLDCAETVQHLWPAEQRVKISAAVKVLRRWIAGKADVEEAKQARRDLYAADAAAADAADAADDEARVKTLARCAAIVRKHYPKLPTLPGKRTAR